MRWLAGMHLNADNMNDNSVEETTGAIFTPAAFFDIASLKARKLNGFTFIDMAITNNSDRSASGSTGNIGDITLGTLSGGWIPQETIVGEFNDFDKAEGSVSWLSNGTVLLKTLSNTAQILSSERLYMSAMWISENK